MCEPVEGTHTEGRSIQGLPAGGGSYHSQIGAAGSVTLSPGVGEVAKGSGEWKQCHNPGTSGDEPGVEEPDEIHPNLSFLAFWSPTGASHSPSPAQK